MPQSFGLLAELPGFVGSAARVARTVLSCYPRTVRAAR